MITPTYIPTWAKKCTYQSGHRKVTYYLWKRANSDVWYWVVAAANGCAPSEQAAREAAINFIKYGEVPPLEV